MDTVMASLFGAIGYGAGYVIPTYYGVNALLSMVICLVAGSILDKAGDKLIFNSSVQKTAGKKYAVFVGSGLLFLSAYFVIAKVYAHSLFSDLGMQLFSMVGIPLISFLVSLGIRYLKKLRLLKKYGSGERGFLFDQEAADAMKALNGENRELSEYTGKDPVVRTVTGSYVGKKDKNGVRFLGISYATAERWKKPVSVDASDKICEAYYFGSSEIQPESSHNTLTHFKQGEDCLNLNVWTATLEPEANKPVFVYIHGGDGRYGGSASPVCYLKNIAEAIPDAVFVSINYRFGLFGVVDFASSGCPDEEEYAESTGLSLLDQLEALKWIKANISAFGGNPENITLAGDSTGGACICMLAATKSAKGLFQRALILGASSQDTPADDEKAAFLGKKLLEEFHAGSIAELKTVTAEQLRDFSKQNYDLLETPPRDGRVVPQNISQAYRNGVASDIEFIFGFAADDISTWQAMLAGEVSFDDLMETYYENFRNLVGTEKENKLDALLQKYMQPGMSVTDAKKSLLADLQYKANVLHDCRTLSAAGNLVRCFCWDVSGDIEKLTANTASMVTAILGNFEIAEQMGYLHDKGLTEIMQALVGKFVQGQKPEFFNNELKGVSEIAWNEFDVDRNCVLHIQKDAILMTEDAFSANVCELEKLMFEE